jgi:type II secretory pathway pseudopilin PulG
MNYISHNSYKNRQSGQSLVEMLMVLPLFFIVLSGFIFIFQQQIRGFTDEMAQSALAVTEANFEKGERSKADWPSALGDSQDLLNKVTENVLNPSAFFSRSVDMKDGVFVDKKPVKQAFKYTNLSEYCSLNAIYDVVAKGNGSFELNTCAPGNAYESLDSKFMTGFEGNFQSRIVNSLYYPQIEFSWPNRPFETSRAVVSFSSSSLGLGFSHKQASLFIPDNGYFNTKCFMDPFDPACSFKAISGKFSRAARDSSKLQVTTCFVEASVTCAGTGPGLPACLAGKAAELINALELGVEAWVCPNTNIALKGTQNVVQDTVYAYSSVIIGRETSLRGEILINK